MYTILPPADGYEIVQVNNADGSIRNDIRRWHKIVNSVSGHVDYGYVTLDLLNKDELYEAFAFAASPNGLPVGISGSMGIGQGFDPLGGANLALLSSKFDNKQAGHSAQFYFAFSDVANYWARVLSESKK